MNVNADETKSFEAMFKVFAQEHNINVGRYCATKLLSFYNHNFDPVMLYQLDADAVVVAVDLRAAAARGYADDGEVLVTRQADGRGDEEAGAAPRNVDELAAPHLGSGKVEAHRHQHALPVDGKAFPFTLVKSCGGPLVGTDAHCHTPAWDIMSDRWTECRRRVFCFVEANP